MKAVQKDETHKQLVIQSNMLIEQTCLTLANFILPTNTNDIDYFDIRVKPTVNGSPRKCISDIKNLIC